MKQTASRYTLSFLSALVALGLSPARATNTYELGSIRVEGAPVSAYRAERVGTATFFAAPPEELPASVDVLTSDFIREQFGKSFRHIYGQQKLKEMLTFETQVTTLEYDWYLRAV